MAGMETIFGLGGKVAIVTGASRGIGEGCARILARAGAKVLLTDILEPEGKKVAEGIRAAGTLDPDLVFLDVGLPDGSGLKM